MATRSTNPVLRHLRRIAFMHQAGSLADGQLLESFRAQREEAAFEALLKRHGPMVLGVCRRVLHNAHDAEDAFQATFLVLVRKAHAIGRPEGLGNWLYGVAYRTALKARAAAARRTAKERQAPPRCAAQPRDDVWDEFLPHLDRELQRLPDKYRLPIVLCDLEGQTRREAARTLGWPEGTLHTRLGRGRALLAKRLRRHGLALSGATLALAFSHQAASAAVPQPLAALTLKAATAFGTGTTTGVISAQVAALTEGVLRSMLLTRLQIATAVLLVVGLIGTGAGLLSRQALADKPAPEAVQKAPGQDSPQTTVEVSGRVQAADAAKHTLTLHFSKQFFGAQTFAVAREVKVLLDDGTGDRLGFQDGTLADLTEGAAVTLRLSTDRKEVVRIWVEGPTVQGVVKAVDADGQTLTAAVVETKGQPAVDRTFTVAKHARLSLEDGKVKDKSKHMPPAGLADLPRGAVVFLRLAADRKTVGSIRAEGPTVQGVVKAVDVAKHTVTVTVTTAKDAPEEDKTFAVAPEALVFIDDGKAKDKSKPQTHRLADLPVGAMVTLRQSLDQKAVVAIHAEGATVHGSVTQVDAAKHTITVASKGEADKTYAVAEDAAVYIDDKPEGRKLGDVPVEAAVTLKLSADQKSVREIRVSGPTVHGVVSGQAGTDTLTIRTKLGEQTLSLARDVRVVIEGTRAGKLTELVDGTVVALRLSADKTAVLAMDAEGPSFQGIVKTVDADKQTITLTIGGKGGVGGEDRTFPLTRDTKVVTAIYGVALKLTDVQADKEVVVRLTLDQKAAGRITVLGQ
jgi:RNA polymerase sigma factor (sigma-70 family)